ncbi:hypothetical protein P6P90_12225 [Ectobacillus antri]|jgi:nitrogen fixation protein FixH|uniref:Secreted protein n=1 Tax=Ectobacillus antri TaxID=2486280 RepID=A0ABT6H6R0_9BACI|nr:MULTISPECIES: hypothetical protein [Ectobacillus]MDG4657728.1 hypothetical protein [Ectobacillus antri]MDG5754735.1 hypothetical protein [Ectobacillus antri]UOY92469.1 hypothetical protein MUG87_18985 [Ectobacillus sp. JY-23]
MKKWIVSAVVLLVVIMGGYLIWNTMQAPKQESGHHGDHGNHGTVATQGDVTAKVSYDNGTFNVLVQDKNGKPIDDLQINHEKIMHMIVVSHDLGQYYHIHPERTGAGTFSVKQDLEPGAYKVFVDIKPKNASYAVAPIDVTIGNGHMHHEALQPETNFTKTVSGKTVTMKPDTFAAGEAVTLRFSFADGSVPKPYLGALGHVVILDEAGEKYVHVHPLSAKETAFETKFDKPGVYKIWAEFQFDEVLVYPFVVEVR